MRVSPWMVVAGLAVVAPLVGACSDAGFNGAPVGAVTPAHDPGGAGAADGKNEAAKAPPRTTADTTDTRATDGSNENERAIPPQPVSGAFLTCDTTPVPAADASVMDAAAVCRIERDGATVDLVGASVRWSAVDANGQTPPAASFSLATLAAGQPWHVRVEWREGRLDDGQVIALVTWADAAADAAPERLAAPLRSSAHHRVETPAAASFHLGNDDYSGSGCKQELNAVPTSGVALAWPIQVAGVTGAASTQVTIGLRDVCGVDYAGVNVVTLRRGDAVVYRTTLAPGVGTQNLPPLALAPGDYRLEVRSEVATAAGDRDDFVIGGLSVQADGGVSAGAPQMSAQ